MSCQARSSSVTPHHDDAPFHWKFKRDTWSEKKKEESEGERQEWQIDEATLVDSKREDNYQREFVVGCLITPRYTCGRGS